MSNEEFKRMTNEAIAMAQNQSRNQTAVQNNSVEAPPIPQGQVAPISNDRSIGSQQPQNVNNFQS